jgi:hypothetical protein
MQRMITPPTFTSSGNESKKVITIILYVLNLLITLKERKILKILTILNAEITFEPESCCTMKSTAEKTVQMKSIMFHGFLK